jgi:hypothetical protein
MKKLKFFNQSTQGFYVVGFFIKTVKAKEIRAK